MLVARVGDALQEPFWPEGLGINRGFLHVYDTADLVQGFAALQAARGGGGQGGDAAGDGGADGAALDALLLRTVPGAHVRLVP